MILYLIFLLFLLLKYALLVSLLLKYALFSGLTRVATPIGGLLLMLIN